MDSNVQFIDDIKPLSENDLYRVRGVPGVQWAVRLYKGITRARLADGTFQQVILLGLDDATMVVRRAEIIVGNLADLRRPDALIMDEAGYHQLWPNEPFELGKTFEMNDRRAVLVGVCKARRTFQTFPIVYTRYSVRPIAFAPSERKVLSFVLAEPEPGLEAADVCRQDHRADGVAGFDSRRFLLEDDLALPEQRRASLSISASRCCSVFSSAPPSRGRRSTCSRSKT